MSHDIDALLAAGNQQHQALSNLPCRCEYNVPYAGLPEAQVLERQCGRCRAMAAWTLATGEKLATAAEAS